MELTVGIVLYNYNEQIVEHLKMLCELFQDIYVFNNSDKEIPDNLEETIKKLKLSYRSVGKNKGLAFGLNSICIRAINDKHKWIMLLDQDSLVKKELVNKMIEFIYKYQSIYKIGCVGPVIQDRYGKKAIQDSLKNKDVIITSGMILNLDCFKEIGWFDNKLFVDFVDYDYCLRLRRAGYDVLQNGNAVLFHNQLDNGQVIHEYQRNKYSAIRHYYNTRNYLFLKREYSEYQNYLLLERDIFWKRIMGMLKYDHSRIEKIVAILLGYFDFYRNKFGRCTWNI
ncbi:MAG: glycosyltransferase [Lachnospiraceae bacterium]|nr:glycosyltransferase [Lachnospiraceae bacterium]